MSKIPVGVLGATGVVGQHFISFLEGHPWFELTWLGASDRSAGKPYYEATQWRLGGNIPAHVRNLVIQECKPGNAPTVLFSAMDSGSATEIEQAYARGGHIIVSNSSNHRMDPDVPLLVPELNPEHLAAIKSQQEKRGWSGMIVTNPNCSTVVLAMALGPFVPFGIKRTVVTTLQAVSGAGYPGVASMDITANVIPYIGGEEEKMERETQKILGSYAAEKFEPLPALVSAHCNRVPTLDGHMMTVSVELANPPTLETAERAIRFFSGLPQERKLPSAPVNPLVYCDDPARPQPRRDVELHRGMACFVGRLRECPVLDFKFVACGHNTIRGAAGAAVLNAELLYSEGFISE